MKFCPLPHWRFSGEIPAGRPCSRKRSLRLLAVTEAAVAVLALTACQADRRVVAVNRASNAAVAPVSAQSGAVPIAREEAFKPEGLWVNSLGMKFVPVPGTKVAFCIWETRVQDYAAFAGEGSGVDGSWKDPVWEGKAVTPGPTHPVVNVNWQDAQEFCRWLTAKERREGRIKPDQEYRLPTDEEWSWAVGLGDREGKGLPKDKDTKGREIYPWGRQWPPPNAAGNYDDVSIYKIPGFQDGYERTAPVGSFQANKQGIHDLGGNVWEWCQDSYDSEGKLRVLRGGSWINNVQDFLLSRYRDRIAPTVRYDCYGFRIVLAGGNSAR